MKKSKLGMNSIHAACEKNNCVMLRLILGDKSKKEIEKAMADKARFSPDSPVECNPIGYFVHADTFIPKFTEICFDKLKIASRIPGVKFNMMPLGDNSADIAYLIQLCMENGIAVPDEMSFDPQKESERFCNFALYSHLFKGVTSVKTTFMNYAVMLGNLRMVLYFIGAGLDINAKDSEGRTPLIYAILSGKIKIAELLLDQHSKYSHMQKADLNATDKHKRTALMMCLERMEGKGQRLTPIRADMLRLLLSSGADTSLKDEVSRTIIQLLHRTGKRSSTIWKSSKETRHT